MRAVVPDLMILDLRMPDLAGDAVLLHLQHTPILRRIPVLIVSGFLDDDRVGADSGLNIVARLPKPITLTRLREAVAAALAGPPPPPSST
jgi:CheY-like chemotaxis protein